MQKLKKFCLDLQKQGIKSYTVYGTEPFRKTKLFLDLLLPEEPKKSFL
jgi:hypothetical protein